MARLTPFGSSAVVEVADELTERYKAQGWTAADKQDKQTDESKRSKKSEQK